MNPRKETARIVRALRAVFAPRGRIAIYLFMTAATFALFIAIPVWLIPGNDFAFQLSIMRPGDFASFVALSGLNALLFLMQWHLYRTHKKSRSMIAGSVASGAGGVSAVFASVLSTASCSSCIAGIFGFLGVGGIFFVMDHRLEFSLLATVIVLVAIIFATRRIDEACASCDTKACPTNL